MQKPFDRNLTNEEKALNHQINTILASEAWVPRSAVKGYFHTDTAYQSGHTI